MAWLARVGGVWCQLKARTDEEECGDGPLGGVESEGGGME